MTTDTLAIPELVAAYWLCPRKAFLLLRGDTGDPAHDYVKIVETEAARVLNKHLDALIANGFEVEQLGGGAPEKDVYVALPRLRAGTLEAKIDVLVRHRSHSSNAQQCHEPQLVIGCNTVNKEHEIILAAMGYVCSRFFNEKIIVGSIVNSDGKVTRIKLPNLDSEVKTIIEILKSWGRQLPFEPPPIILNSHCKICQFRTACQAQAEREDNLSLLDRMTPKIFMKYKNKGIVTVTQLSYLFRPRRWIRRKSKNNLTDRFSLELQALALRTKKIYIVHRQPIPTYPLEIYLDIEGLPDHDFFYLIGVVIASGDHCELHSMWADSQKDEADVFNKLIELACRYPEAPIFHYGNYEQKCVERLSEKYGIDCSHIVCRLVNVNKFIFGKLYFPVRSNTLKDLAQYIGFAWSIEGASGLKSIVWRLQWEKLHDTDVKNKLLTYNLEDCHALRVLVKELRKIANAAEMRCDVEYADASKQSSTSLGRIIHDEFERILKSAHSDDKIVHLKIGKKEVETPIAGKRRGGVIGHQAYKRISPAKVDKVIRVRRRIKCPLHKDRPLESTNKFAEYTITDLKFTDKGCKKTTTRYFGSLAHCSICDHDYRPPRIDGFSSFGHRFKAWIVYQRIVLRLPYGAIIQATEVLFHETISQSTIVNWMVNMAKYYEPSELAILKEMLKSPFIHVDETKINVQGNDQYVWVFTDGRHAVFRLTETRESEIVRAVLDGYDGVLISDFYGGYDSCKCRQQKCLVHLIRDLNDDLWKNPFHAELETFVGAFKNLLLRIMAGVDRYGLKQRYLKKYKTEVESFYSKFINDHDSEDEIIQRYQKRFRRYKTSLFTFLSENGIPWNNNTAERAIRHLAVQRKISGTFFERLAGPYLRLLGIAQSCRFQQKSFFEFLISEETEVDQFKPRRRRRTTEAIRSSSSWSVQQNEWLP